jgi:hypothetical protein
MSAFQPEKDRKSVRMLPRFVTPSGKAALDAHAAGQHPMPRTTQLSNLLRHPFSLVWQACGITPRPHAGAAVRPA